MKLQTGLLAAVVMLSMGLAARAVETTVWQIGNLDDTYADLAIPGNYAAYQAQFPNDVSFTIGKDDPTRAWPFIHPGPDDVWARPRAHRPKTHRFAVHFDLAEQPRGVFTLTIDMISTHPTAPPTYSILINGKGGEMQLPNGSDAALTDPSQGKQFVLRVPIPASLLKQGKNDLVLTATRGSWLIYDGLVLTNDPDRTCSDVKITSASLRPTTRFVRSGGKLWQIANLSVQFSESMTSADAVVYAAGSMRRVLLNSGPLGEANVEVHLPEVTQPTTVRCAITCRGQFRTQIFTFDLKPQRRWSLYVQPSAHVDIGYTDYQERVIKRHNDNMSTALDLCTRYPGFKWNTEAAWVEDNYLSLMPAAQKADFIKYARDGRIGCQAIYGNMLTGLLSHEEIIRSLYYARATATKYGIPFDIAMSSDVPTQVWTLPMILAGSGIRYYSAGLNLWRANSFGRLFGKSPFYWQGPDGSRVMTWLSPGYAQANMLGLANSVEHAAPRIDDFLRRFERAGYPYDAVLAFGGFGDNQRLNPNLAAVVEQWNATYAYPKIILCRGPEFFRAIEKQAVAKKQQPKVLHGDGGVYWEDGAASSAAETAMVRTAKEKLVAAEKLHALVGGPYPTEQIGKGWRNAILYDEHTWGAANSVRDPQGDQTLHQWRYKANFAAQAAQIADSALESGLRKLAALTKPNRDCVVVFNPLSWSVSGPVLVRTEDGKLVETWVDNIPALGYATLPTPALSGAAPISTSHSNIVENRFYRITIDPKTGAVTSIYDKHLERELVDTTAPYGVNEYIYVKGQGASARDVTRSDGAIPVIIDVEQRPYWQRVTIKGSACNTPEWTTRITLYNNTKRIDFANTLRKIETADKEAGYFAFPFAVSRPRFHIEIADGEMQAGKDILDGACMSWYCAQDYAAVEEPGCAIVWSAVDSPLLTLCDINRERFESPLPLTNGHIYAYVFNNYWNTNYKAGQGGEMTFRFSMTSMPSYDRLDAARFGQSVRTAMCGITVRGTRPYLRSESRLSDSLCSVSPANVVIQSVKKAESGRGLILRLREVGGEKTTASVKLPAGNFREAYACNLVEVIGKRLPISGGRVTVPLAANGLATVRIR